MNTLGGVSGCDRDWTIVWAAVGDASSAGGLATRAPGITKSAGGRSHVIRPLVHCEATVQRCSTPPT